MATGKEALAKILATSDKKYGFPVGSLAEIAVPAKWISTGNMAIDYVTGGGLPLGRTVELAGNPSSGKTTSALQAAANLQKLIKDGGDPERGITPDDIIMYFDYESAMDPEYAKALGLDVDHHSFKFGQPSSLEDGTNFALSLAETGLVRMMIFDSVAAMLPDTEKNKDVGEHSVAVRAKLMTDFINKMNPIAAENNVSIVLINHTKEKIGIGSYPGAAVTTTPGGVGLKYYSSIRVEFKMLKQHKTDQVDPITGDTVSRVTSTDVKVRTVKNKLAPPYRESAVRVRFGSGFDNLFTALLVLVAHKKIMYNAGIYYFHKIEDVGGAPEWMPRQTTGIKRPFIKGIENLNNAAKLNPEWRDLLISIAEPLIYEVPGVSSDEDDVEEVDEPTPNKVSL
jgi:recombination protein RecA